LDWRYFAAGGVSAAASHGYTTPIDVIKTRMQTNPELYNGSISVCVKHICETEGPLFLLTGLLPTCVGYGVEGALKFGCYELCKPFFAQTTSSDLVNALLASTVAGAVASVVLCPAEDVRIRLVADPSYAPGAVAALRRRSAEDGALSSFAAFPAMLSKQVPYTMGKQVSFDFMCELVQSLIAVFFVAGSAQFAYADSLTPAIAAFPAAIVACLMSHPGDTLLTQYFKGSLGNGGVFAALNNMVQSGGVGTLFVGLKARLFHVIGIIWVQLIIYDTVKQWLGLPATGH